MLGKKYSVFGTFLSFLIKMFLNFIASTSFFFNLLIPLYDVIEIHYIKFSNILKEKKINNDSILRKITVTILVSLKYLKSTIKRIL